MPQYAYWGTIHQHNKYIYKHHDGNFVDFFFDEDWRMVKGEKTSWVGACERFVWKKKMLLLWKGKWGRENIFILFIFRGRKHSINRIGKKIYWAWCRCTMYVNLSLFKAKVRFLDRNWLKLHWLMWVFSGIPIEREH